MKKLIIFLCVMMFSQSVYGAQVKVSALGAIIMDAESGRVLWEKQSDKVLSMASTTKIMTAIIALESSNINEVTTVTKRAALAPEVSLGINTGEEYIIKDLLYPLMLQSSNDAAIAIAEGVAGTVEDFATLMNEKAKELGANNTIFVTPNGLDEGEHSSTAYDMALITKYALENEEFVELINTKNYTLHCRNKSRVFDVNNKNRLLNQYEGAIGVKTGFTNKAGHCFVGAVRQGEKTLITVVLGSGWGSAGKEQKWIDTKNLLNYGFENFEKVKILDKNTFCGTVDVIQSEIKTVEGEIKEEGYAMLSEDELETVHTEIRMVKAMEAPIEKGEVLGKAIVYTDTGEVLFKTEIVAKNSVERKTFKNSVSKVLNFWFN
ncbi:MAG: D-alanyl-D-alanine carboxypeptidase family protein [Anaerotignaceae bacterium]